ncbi:hypothetical protein Tco_0373349 [Tanacetum coccineum]
MRQVQLPPHLAETYHPFSMADTFNMALIINLNSICINTSPYRRRRLLLSQEQLEYGESDAGIDLSSRYHGAIFHTSELINRPTTAQQIGRTSIFGRCGERLQSSALILVVN